MNAQTLAEGRGDEQRQHGHIPTCNMNTYTHIHDNTYTCIHELTQTQTEGRGDEPMQHEHKHPPQTLKTLEFR